jgi:hypothetical protein
MEGKKIILIGSGLLMISGIITGLTYVYKKYNISIKDLLTNRQKDKELRNIIFRRIEKIF